MKGNKKNGGPKISQGYYRRQGKTTKQNRKIEQEKMMKIERMKENGKKNLHARASHALDKGDSKVLLIYDNHLNKGLYIYSGKEIR